MKTALVLLTVVMAVAVNLPDRMTAGVGIDTRYLTAALIALIAIGLIAHRKLLFALLLVAIAVYAKLHGIPFLA